MLLTIVFVLMRSALYLPEMICIGQKQARIRSDLGALSQLKSLRG